VLDPVLKRIIQASAWGLLKGRVVLPSALIAEWLSMATQNTDRIVALGVQFAPDRASLSVDVKGPLSAQMRVAADVALAGTALDAESFYLRLRIVEKPYIKDAGPVGNTFMEQAVGAASSFALELLETQTLVKWIDGAAKPIVRGEEDTLHIDFDHIAVVHEIFSRPLPIGRLRDALTLVHAHISQEGLVLYARVHWGRMLQALASHLLHRRSNAKTA
jgi:hypothetical protein